MHSHFWRVIRVMINLVQYQCRKAKTICSSLKKCNILQLNNTVFIHFVYKNIYTLFIHKFLYSIYTLCIQKYLYIIYTQIFIHYLYIIYTKNIYTNRKFLYLNRSSSLIPKNFASFLSQLIRSHNELPSFITNRCPIFLCVEGLVIHCMFLHQCVSAQFPVRILVKRVHNCLISIEK